MLPPGDGFQRHLRPPMQRTRHGRSVPWAHSLVGSTPLVKSRTVERFAWNGSIARRNGGAVVVVNGWRRYIRTECKCAACRDRIVRRVTVTPGVPKHNAGNRSRLLG